MAPHSSTLACKIPWIEEPGGLQSMGSLRVRHDFTFTFHFHALEKEMATHSSVLAWRNPGTGEPGGLPSMGSHRVGHDWSDLAACVGFPGGSHGKEYACNAGELISISSSWFPRIFLGTRSSWVRKFPDLPGSWRYPGEGNGYPFQYSCLESAMDRGDWHATVHR